jgi:hypothetical protein
MSAEQRPKGQRKTYTEAGVLVIDQAEFLRARRSPRLRQLMSEVEAYDAQLRREYPEAGKSPDGTSD